jgi:hypothetical protein
MMIRIVSNRRDVSVQDFRMDDNAFRGVLWLKACTVKTFLLFNRYEGYWSSRAQLCCYQASGWVQASQILVCGEKRFQINSPTIFLLNFCSLTIWRIEKIPICNWFFCEHIQNQYFSLSTNNFHKSWDVSRIFAKRWILFWKDYFKESDRSYSFDIFTLFVLTFLFFVHTLLVW